MPPVVFWAVARPASARPRRARPRPDTILLVGLLVIVVVAAVFRLVHLGTNLPQVVSPDEPTVMDRALGILRGVTPTQWDWPTGAMELRAAAIWVGRALTPWLDGPPPWLFGRVVFAVVGLVAVFLTGVVATRLADDDRSRRILGWGAAGLVGVSYLSVRLSRAPQPDHLQLCFMLGAALCLLSYDRKRTLALIAGAGVLAGLAGATKYLGILILLPAAASILWRRPGETVDRVRHLIVLIIGAVVGFLIGAPGALIETDGFTDGVREQFGHQAGGHLGYDGDASGWWFHFTKSLPGNWGWLVTLLAAAGVVWVLAKGTREQRLVAGFVVLLYTVVGLSRVEFPHYMVILLPFLAPMAVITVVRLAQLVPTRFAAAGVAVLAVVVLASLVPTVLNDVRLVRAAGAPDTRTLAAPRIETLPGLVISERYGALGGKAAQISDFGSHPEVLGCRCFAVVSSYMEERYRREPSRFPDQVGVYDAMRRRGRVIGVIRPRVHLAYNWDVLPRWGLDDLPVTGAIPAAGPTITIIDLRAGP